MAMLLDSTELLAERDPDPPGPRFQAAPWETEVVLDVWIDVERSPVTVRLEGTLDGSTGSNLIAVVEELIGDGYREFELRTPSLRVPDADGASLLADLRHVVDSVGGHLLYDATPPPSHVVMAA